MVLIITRKVEPFIALLVIGLLTALAAGLPVRVRRRNQASRCWRRGSAAFSARSSRRPAARTC
ncbi:hypothetical protein [Actinophytocola sp. KF-1]